MKKKLKQNIVNLRTEVEEFFDFMDRDFDGQLSFEEFMGEESTIEKLFKDMDRNGDGLVSKQVELITPDTWNVIYLLQEFLTICTNLTDEEVEIAFQKFDTSGDDMLDYREFCTMINNKREQKS